MTKPTGVTFLGIPQDTYLDKMVDNSDIQTLLGKTDGVLNFTDTGSEGISLNDVFVLGDTSDEVVEFVIDLLLEDSRFNSK